MPRSCLGGHAVPCGCYACHCLGGTRVTGVSVTFSVVTEVLPVALSAFRVRSGDTYERRG